MSDRKPIDELYEKIITGQADASFLMKQELPLLLKLSGRVRKKKDADKKADLKIAILGSYSIQHFSMMLEMFLLGMGISANIYEGEDNGIRMDVLNEDSEFYRFGPDLTLLLMDHRDIRHLPDPLQEERETESMLQETMTVFTGLWEKIKENLPACQIFQTNLVIPSEQPLGNLEAGAGYSHSEFFRRINHELTINHPDGVCIVDMEADAAYIGKRIWFDHASYFMNKAGFSADALPQVCADFARLIGAARGKVFKCLVLDLDNTLWDGVVGDDGAEGINLDPHDAVGEAYRYFQNYLKELKKRGVILAVCSKNDEDIAREPFEKNQDMILKLSDISCFVANWDDKAQNIKRIASKLNIGTDSMVFVDDNPAEREIVRRYLPEVLVVDMPDDPSYYARAVDETGAFSWLQITKEDLERTGTYAANAQRDELKESFVDYDEYLKALDMRASVGEPDKAQIKRFSQLINKSNQFNLRTIRYTEEEILCMKEDPGIKLIYVDLKDRFSEYGIISCIILKKTGNECFIDTWLMSCRVLKRGVELLAFDAVHKAAVSWGCDRIRGEYIPTKKNKMVEKFYPELGFIPCEDGTYELYTKAYNKGTFFIASNDL